MLRRGMITAPYEDVDSDAGEESLRSQSEECSPSPAPTYAMAEIRRMSALMSRMSLMQERIMDRLLDLEVRTRDIQYALTDGTSSRVVPDYASNADTESVVQARTSSRGVRYTQNMQLFSAMIIGLVTCVRDTVESRECSSYQSGLSQHFNGLTRVLSLLAANSKPSIPIPKVLQDDYLMEAFQRTSKGAIPVIDGQTLKTVRDYRARSDIFRALCDLMAALKSVPECICPPGREVICSIAHSIIDERGSMQLDVDAISVRKPSPDEVAFGKLNVNAYKYYVPLRMSGMSASYSLEQAIADLSREQEVKMRGDTSKQVKKSELSRQAKIEAAARFTPFNI